MYIKKIYDNSKIDPEQLKKDFALHLELDHPNIPSAVELVSLTNKTVLIYEYVDGITLEKYIDVYGTATELTAVDWFFQLLDILEYIHTEFSSPIIHRDIKPANIIIDKNKQLHLIDFGIARIFRERILKDTVVLGSHGFAPPEQYGLNQTDVRTDLYSTAVTIYYSLTGTSLSEPPYQVLPLNTFNKNFSKRLSEILIKATKPDPDKRFQSVASLKPVILKHLRSLIQRKPRIILTVSAIIALLVISAFSISSISQNIKYRDIPRPRSPEANIVDDNLKEALISVGVDYYPDGILTEEELKKSTIDLYFNNKDIKDLSGMEHMVRTVHLELQGNPINDHSPLHSMVSLEVLYLDDTGLVSLDGFENLKEIRLFSLDNNPITDISPLLGLEQLHDLWLAKTNVSDISGIDNIDSLRDFSFQDTDITDVTPLAGLENMNSVDLRNCEISSILPLEDKTNLIKLWISGNRIDFNDTSEQAALDKLLSNGVNVEYLPQNTEQDEPDLKLLTDDEAYIPDKNLYNALISNDIDLDEDGILEITEMNTVDWFIDIRNGDILDLTGLRHLNNIPGIQLEGNPVENYSDLYLLTQLNELYMHGMRSEYLDLSSISSLKSLRTLGLNSNDLTDISPLFDLVNLENLILFDNNIESDSLLGISNLSNLKWLCLNRNLVTDTTPVNSLNELVYLELQENPVSDITPLIELSNLNDLIVFRAILDLDDATQRNALDVLEYNGVSIDLLPQRPNPAVSSPEVTVPDKNLKNTLFEMGADYDSDGILTQNELGFMIGVIDLTNRDITNLEGLEYAVSVIEINLSGNSELTFENMEALTEMTSLESLWINHVELDTLQGLPMPPDLKYLDIEFNDITSLTPITEYNHIEIIKAGGNRIDANGLTGINKLTNMHHLNVSANQLEDLSPLSDMDNISRLEIQNNFYNDLSPLISMDGLTAVDMDGNYIDLSDNTQKIIIEELTQRGVILSLNPQKTD